MTTSTGTTTKKPERTITIDWSMQQMPQDGFLAEMGTGLEVSNQGLGISADPQWRYGSGCGQELLTFSEIVRYVGHGATVYEAARMSAFKNIDAWEQDADFQRASAKYHTKFQKVLSLIESKSMKPADALKLLKNGINDALMDSSTLTEEQTLSVFSRFKYSHYTASKSAKEIPAMMDALLSGALPYAIFENGYDKTSVAKMCSELFSPGKKSELTEAEREELKSNPEDIILVMELMKVHQPTESYRDAFRSIGITYRALKEFGEDAVRKVHPETLFCTLRDGSYLGVEGALTVDGFLHYLAGTGDFRFVHNTTTDIHVGVGNGTRAGFDLSWGDCIDLMNSGLKFEGIVQFLFARGMSVDEALEYTKENPAPLLIEGDL